VEKSLESQTKMLQPVTFQLQNHRFLGDLRVLQVTGYDLLLRMDWLHNHSPVEMDCKIGQLTVTDQNQKISLLVHSPTASIHFCEQIVSVPKELHQGHEVFLAHLSCLEVFSPVSPNYNSKVQDILSSFQAVFAEPTSLPPQRPIDHQIILKPDSKPINLRPYCFSYFQKLEIEKILYDLLKNKFIQPSTSYFASPVLLVKKKDNSWRLCIDYRKLNDITVKNKFSISIINDLLDELKNAKLFSKIDLKLEYHQIRMHPQSISLTSFRTHERNSVLQLIGTTVSGQKRTVNLFKLKGKLTEGPAFSNNLKI
jgi:Reverse transcriptase (RNA-dependent DNA polymerase)/Retroviral aspartyl protease